MNASTLAETMSSKAPTVSLEGFLEHVGLSNPFVNDRVVQPALAAELDAAAVHQAQSRQLEDLARTVCRLHTGIGVVLWGEAGVGKSHLLSRLARWAHKDEQACFVYVQNLQPNPLFLPRSLLRITVSILSQGRQAQFRTTPLFCLVDAAVKTALRESAEKLEPDQAYAQLLDRLSTQNIAQPALVDRTIYGVLLHFLKAAAAQTTSGDEIAYLAVRWLSGDILDREEAQRLGLHANGEMTTLADDQHIKLALVALSQMALFAGKPLILCFDQVENVDNEQIGALTRFLQAVIDSAPNLLVVTTGVNETLQQWQQEKVIHTAAWDRIAQYIVLVPRVSPHEARQIVEARLDHFITPFLDLLQVKSSVQSDHLFPLGGSWFRNFVKDAVEMSPRQVIKRSRDRWSDQQKRLQTLGGSKWFADWEKDSKGERKDEPPLDQLIDVLIHTKLQDQKTQRQLDPATLPPDADNLSGLTLALLRQCLGGARPYPLTAASEAPAPAKRQRPAYHLLTQRQDGGSSITTAVLFLTTAQSATTNTAALRRVVEDRKPTKELVFVTDKRCPLRLGAKGNEYLRQIQDRHGASFQPIDLTFDQYADLDALKVVAGLARSGDLEVDLPNNKPRRVTEPEVVDSHHRCDRYAGHELLRALLGLTKGAPSGTNPGALEINERDLREFIMAQLGISFGASSKELTIRYLGYLGYPSGEEAHYRPGVERVILVLHNEGFVAATPCDGYLSVLPKRR